MEETNQLLRYMLEELRGLRTELEELNESMYDVINSI